MSGVEAMLYSEWILHCDAYVAFLLRLTIKCISISMGTTEPINCMSISMGTTEEVLCKKDTPQDKRDKMLWSIHNVNNDA